MNAPLTPEDVEIIEKTASFQGYFKIDRYRLKHRLFEGGWSSEFTREVFERGHAVAVLLYDPDRDRVVLIEQFRIGAHAALASPHWAPDHHTPWLVELVAGIIEDGETPTDVARREAVEEADCAVTDLVPICHYLVSPGGSSETMAIFCGRIDSSQADGIHGMTEEHENIRVLNIATEEAFEALETGRINNSMTIIALQWLRLNHADLQARWRSAKPGPAA